MSQTSSVRETATYCGHRHADVTPQECFACILHMEADPDVYLKAPVPLDSLGSLGVRIELDSNPDYGYQCLQACRAKHLNPDTREGQSVG